MAFTFADMKKKILNSGARFTMLFFLIMFTSCVSMSDWEMDKSAGINGGFEIFRKGIPVNWLVFTPATVKPTATFSISADSVNPSEGKVSLRFDVQSCDSMGDRHSPGICNEFPVEEGKTYLVRYRLRNTGCRIKVRLGAIKMDAGKQFTAYDSNRPIKEWELIEQEIKVEKGLNRIRFVFNALTPGTCWLDDFTLTER